ncbi:hypothetical protein LXL04_031819 [Taraxacum kok-saghyz]
MLIDDPEPQNEQIDAIPDEFNPNYLKAYYGSINEVNQIAQICYHVLGLVHGIWTPIPRAVCLLTILPLILTLYFTFTDERLHCNPKAQWLSEPSDLHLSFSSELLSYHLCVQIRTEEMDLIAERGIAAHYSGKVIVNGLVRHTVANDRHMKGKPICLNNANVALRIGWLNSIREWQEEFVGNMSSREFVDTITKDLLGSRVFVFTPRGEIKNLPKGATVIDYGYMIHTDIGNNMVAAKVNGNIVPFSILHTKSSRRYYRISN